MKKKTIFFAAEPEFLHLAQAVSGNLFDLKFCSSLEKAEVLLGSAESNKNIDMIVCGLHFDGGRMHELLSLAKSSEKTWSIPFLCVKLRDGNMTSHMLNSIKTSCEALGAQGFLHFPDILSKHGELAAYGMFRNALRDLLEKRIDTERMREDTHVAASENPAHRRIA